MAIKNPLRYPGAKSKLYCYIKCLLEAEDKIGCEFYEPFAGSASLSFMLLENNIVSRAIINEKDPLLYYFWIAVFRNTNELIDLIQKTEITIDNWLEFSKYRDIEYTKDKTPVNIGFSGLYLNRTNFSGILKANPLGGLSQISSYKLNCRFNKETIIKSIKEIAELKDRISIYNLDAIDFMKQYLKYKRNKNTFVYIDPPYYKAGPGLYRYFYNHEDHIDLAKFIKTKAFPWLISYDDVEEIRKMYNKSSCVNLYMDYSVKTSKKGKELLISNLMIPPILQTEVIKKDII